MAFKSITTSHFEKRFSKLTYKNKTFKHQIINKMKWIRQNPEMGEPKSHNLRGLRALHISEHFVVVYIIFKNFIIFINLGHHDNAYDSETMNRLTKHLLEDESLLTALKASDIQIEDFVDLVRSLGKKN